MDKPFDPTKPVQTRDGRKARIICTDRKHEYNWPIVALIEYEGAESVMSYNADGRAMTRVRPDQPHTPPNDLINIPARIHREVWMNIHTHHVARIYESREIADDLKDAYGPRLACIPITIDCEEGEGLGEERS